MQLPKNEKQLTEIFKNASAPQVSDFDGEYYVEMLTGGLPSLRKFSHRKIFHREGGKVVGCNILLKNIKWGHFFLEDVGTEHCSVPTTGMVINYNVTKNSFLTKGIRDHVRRVEDGLYLGRFNVLIGGKLRFLGYFSLTKIK